MRQKYRNDFVKCNGNNCKHKKQCERYAAHLEAEVLKLEKIIYTSSDDCIQNQFLNLIIKEK